jgi:F-type H+-transporting ATPase subunit b
LLKEARTNGAEIVAQAKTDAQAEADKVIAQAQESIQNEKRAAINELKNQVAQISLEIAEKVIDSELDSKDKQAKLVDKLIKDASL